MRFEIDFNTESDDNLLKRLGAKRESVNDFSYFVIDFSNYKELEEFMNKVNKIKGKDYTALISFNQPTIYLDAEV